MPVVFFWDKMPVIFLCGQMPFFVDKITLSYYLTYKSFESEDFCQSLNRDFY